MVIPSIPFAEISQHLQRPSSDNLRTGDGRVARRSNLHRPLRVCDGSRADEKFGLGAGPVAYWREQVRFVRFYFPSVLSVLTMYFKYRELISPVSSLVY